MFVSEDFKKLFFNFYCIVCIEGLCNNEKLFFEKNEKKMRKTSVFCLKNTIILYRNLKIR